jgi:two-component system, NarL family, response regulator
MNLSPQQPMRVLVVDDHPVVRIGISAMIQASPDMTVVAEASTAEEALQLFPRLRPDITLMDLRLPMMSGAQAIRAIRQIEPAAKFVVLTTYEGDEDIRQALEAGAKGYVIKGMSREVLLSALRRVHARGRYLPKLVSEALTCRVPNSRLSAREREVLSLMATGKTNKEIASLLGITEATVKGHVSLIFMRMNVTDRTEAVITALRRGLVHL